MEFSSNTGARVLCEPDWIASNTTELQIAKAIADAGMDVILRTRSGVEKVKTPDSFVWTETGWQEWEFKTVGRGSSIHTSVQKNLRMGRLQSPNVLLLLPEEIVAQGGLAQVLRGIGAAVFHDADGLLKQVILMSSDGNIQRGNVDDISNGKFQFEEF